MKQTLALAILYMISAISVVRAQTALPYDSHSTPALIPTTSTVAFSTYLDLYELVFSNTTGSAITVYVYDRQATPVAVGVMNIPSNTILVVPYPGGYYCVGGITWSASATGVVGYLSGRHGSVVSQ